MKRLIAALAGALVFLCFAPQAQAMRPPQPGCHRVAYTPPGGGDPIEVVVCP